MSGQITPQKKRNCRRTPYELRQHEIAVKIRKMKNVSIKMMTGTSSWRLESKEDIDRYMDSLRKSLEEQLDEDTIVNVEF